MEKKTKEQILEEMRVYRETATPIPEADARRLVQKWIESDDDKDGGSAQ